MSFPLLASDACYWERRYNKEYDSLLNANDFELALEDYSLLKSSERYKNNLNNLRWFQLDSPTIYTKDLSHFLNYLTYIVSLKLLRENESSIYTLEKYFTDQVIAFLTRNRVPSIQIKKIYDYWNNTYKFLELLISSSQKYKHINTNTSVYFNTKNDMYKFDIPMLGWNDTTHVDCYLFVTYSGNKPNWFTIPSLYRIYKYYANHNIALNNVKLYWFNLDSEIVRPLLENIPLTQNVATMISRYSSIEPFPFENIFNKNNTKYYNTTPLSTILKQ